MTWVLAETPVTADACHGSFAGLERHRTSVPRAQAGRAAYLGPVRAALGQKADSSGARRPFAVSCDTAGSMAGRHCGTWSAQVSGAYLEEGQSTAWMAERYSVGVDECRALVAASERTV